MMTKEPNHVYQQSAALDRRREALHLGGSSSDRPVHQRSMPPSSDGAGPVLCLGAASPAGRAQRSQEQQAWPQDIGPDRAIAGADSAVAGGRGGDLRREPGPENGVLAAARLNPESRAR